MCYIYTFDCMLLLRFLNTIQLCYYVLPYKINVIYIINEIRRRKVVWKIEQLVRHVYIHVYKLQTLTVCLEPHHWAGYV